MNKLYLPIPEFAQFVGSIKPVSKQEDNIFRTVNEIINKHIGNCADIALLVTEYCKLHGYSHKVANIGIAYFNSNNDRIVVNHQSHVVCIFQYRNKWNIIQQCDDMQPLFIGNYSFKEGSLKKGQTFDVSFLDFSKPCLYASFHSLSSILHEGSFAST